MTRNPVIEHVVYRKFLPALFVEIAKHDAQVAYAAATTRTLYEITGKGVAIVVPPMDIGPYLNSLITDIEYVLDHEKTRAQIVSSLEGQGDIHMRPLSEDDSSPQ